MNRIDRLTAILVQLQSKKVVRASEIAGRFDISLRTVYRDIRALEEAGVPIGAEAGKGYFISDGYFLPPVMFTDEEASAMLLGAKLIERMSDESINEKFNSALYKIKSVLRSSGKEVLEDLHSQIIVQKRQQKDKIDSNFLSDIQKSIVSKKAADIKYYAHYREETTKRIVEPIGLFHYSNAWHLIAYCRLRKDYRDFRVDRIRDFRLIDECFTISDHKSLNEYIKSVSQSNEDVILVKVRIKNEIAKLIFEEKYIYGFVDETKYEKETEMTFMTMYPDFIARWFLMFGSSVKVVSPDNVKTLLKSFVNELKNHYL